MKGLIDVSRQAVDDSGPYPDGSGKRSTALVSAHQGLSLSAFRLNASTVDLFVGYIGRFQSVGVKNSSDWAEKWT